MQAIQPEVTELQRQVGEMRDRMSVTESQILQLNRTSSDTSRQTIWQFVVFTITMAAILISVLNYQTNQIEAKFNLRADTIELRINSLEKRLDQRIEQLDKNMNARFEDLKQEVRNRK